MCNLNPALTPPLYLMSKHTAVGMGTFLNEEKLVISLHYYITFPYIHFDIKLSFGAILVAATVYTFGFIMAPKNNRLNVTTVDSSQNTNPSPFILNNGNNIT